MRKVNFLVFLLMVLSVNASAFWGGNNFFPFTSGLNSGYNNPWAGTSNTNWGPFATADQWSPENDAANMSRYGAHPRSLQQYKEDPRFRPENIATETQNLVKPSNWLTDTDFSATLEKIKDTGNKTFFVNETPTSFDQGYQRIKSETENIDKAVKDYIQQYSNQLGSVDGIYGKQGYALSPAALSTARIVKNN